MRWRYQAAARTAATPSAATYKCGEKHAQRCIGHSAATHDQHGQQRLGRPKSEGGEGWPRHGNAAAEESACTQERPPLVSSSRLSASTTKSMGMELMRPYALWTAAASAFMSRYKGAAQGMNKTTCEKHQTI